MKRTAMYSSQLSGSNRINGVEQLNDITTSQLLLCLVARIATLVNAPIEWLRKYYSTIMEREINIRQTWVLIHAQVAFLFAAIPANFPLLLRALCVFWFLYALLHCKKEFGNQNI